MSEIPDSPALARTEHGTRTSPAASEADVTQALRLLATNAGNFKATAEQLEGAGIVGISKHRLKAWATTTFRARYMEIRREQAAHVSESLAGNALERAHEADAVQADAIRRLAERLDELDAKDLAPTVRALAQSKDSDVKIAQLLRDRPTEIKEHRSVQELMRVLNSVPNLIEDEVPYEAEVVEEE